MAKLPAFDFKGYRTSFPVGVKTDMMAIVLTHDDGTWANHLIFEFNDVPYATLPICDRDGLKKIIKALRDIDKNAFGETND